MTTDETGTEAQRLAALRAKIDAVDESIHALLMQRAGVIDELIAVKGAGERRGAAFRPGREAAMMNVLAKRHAGSIPLTMIVHIWREIIATFTFLQAPYRVHVGGDDPSLRDCARFQFGFSVPLHTHENAAAALDTVQAEGDALAVVSLADTAGQTPWWERLGDKEGLFVMARLPDLSGSARADILVVAPRLSDPAPFPHSLHIVHMNDPEALAGMTCLARSDDPAGGVRALVELPHDAAAPAAALDIRPAGGYFPPVPQMLWAPQDDQ